jgi:predicted enzyme related to lactoylglutathione lyase
MLVFRFERGTAIVGRIIHVELTAADVDRAADFYAKAFGWQSTASPFVDGYLVAETGTGDGIDGAIMRREYRDQLAYITDTEGTLVGLRQPA